MDWANVAGWLFTLGCVAPLAAVGLGIFAALALLTWDHFLN